MMAVQHRVRFFTCVVFVLFAGAQSMASVTLNFAHIADGSDSNGVWTTNISLVSMTSFPANCTVLLSGDDGTPLSLATNLGTASTFTFLVPAAGTAGVVTNGIGVNGKVVGGYA